MSKHNPWHIFDVPVAGADGSTGHVGGPFRTRADALKAVNRYTEQAAQLYSDDESKQLRVCAQYNPGYFCYARGRSHIIVITESALLKGGSLTLPPDLPDLS